MPLLSETGEGIRDAFAKGNQCPAFIHKGESREIFPNVLFLNCFQFKIMLMLKCHIWGWHILIPFSSLGRVGTFEKKSIESEFQFHHIVALWSWTMIIRDNIYWTRHYGTVLYSLSRWILRITLQHYVSYYFHLSTYENTETIAFINLSTAHN